MYNNCKVLILHNCIAPYRHHIFEKISKAYPTLVVYLSEYCTIKRGWNPFPRKYNYKYLILSEKRNVLSILKNIELLFKIMLNYKPKIVIIGGHSEVEMKIVAILSRILKSKLIYWTESNEIYESTLPYMQRVFTRLQRIFFSKLSSAVMVPGKISYVSERKILGKERVFIVPNSIDESIWLRFSCSQNELINLLSIWRENLRLKTTVLLFVGRITSAKGVVPLILASIKLLSEGYNFILLVAGDGPLKEPLESLVRKKKYNDQIVFLGSIFDPALLSELYKIADVVLLPSYRDVWGFVINEAALFRKLIIASKYSQAAYILLEGTPMLLDNVNAKNIYQVIKNYLNARYFFDKYKSVIEKRYRKYFHPVLSYRALCKVILTFCSEKPSG